MKDFKMDKTFSKAQSFEQADKSNIFDINTTPAERLRMAFHLSCTINGIKESDSLKLDRTIFSAYKFKQA